MAETEITEDSLKQTITTRIGATHVEVTDTSGGCGQSFTVLVVSPQFAGQNKLKRHRTVNAALKDEIARIHAWSAKCQTPEEWDKDRATNKDESGPSMEGTVGGQVEGVSG